MYAGALASLPVIWQVVIVFGLTVIAIVIWWWTWRLVVWSLRKRVKIGERIEIILSNPIATAIWTVGGMWCVAYLVRGGMDRFIT